MKDKKNIIILGSTGSVGENAVKVAEHLSDELRVVGLAGNTRVERLVEQATKLDCPNIAVGDVENLEALRRGAAATCKTYGGLEGLVELATLPEVDIVLCAISGTSGLFPVLEAIRAGKDIALASKEILVMAGELVMEEVKKHNVRILPVDSEHSAIFQCLEGRKKDEVEKLILTASGGPFRQASYEEMRNASFKRALDHPTWNMGAKITIDSATMMNKALEIIEAKWLFDVDGDNIDVVVHPQSIIHSMVEFVDGTILAQMSSPDMRFPIQYALTYPHKHPHGVKPLNFSTLGSLTFEEPDTERFPALEYAHEALRVGGTMPAVMNAANEVAVAKFSQECPVSKSQKIRFTDIPEVIHKTMTAHDVVPHPDLSTILAADEWAREFATCAANDFSDK